MAGQAPTVVLPSLRLAEAWTGVPARRERIARELGALGDRSGLAVAAALHHELGRIAERAGKVDEALAHYQTAHVHDPGAIATIWAIRRIHEVGSRWQDVLQTLKAELAALSDPRAQSQVWTERGMLVWSRLSDASEARRAFEEAVLLDPRAVRPCQLLEWLEAVHGDPAARLGRLAQLAERMPAPELASAYRVELAFEEWRKDGSDRGRAAAIMQAALNGAAAPSAVLDAIEYFAEESGSAHVLLAALEERRALVEGASAASRLEVQSILLWSAAVAAGPGKDPMAALSEYREAIAMAPEPEMLPELIRRAAWAGAWSVAQAVAAALGPANATQSAAYALLAGKPDVARAELKARMDATPDDWIAGLLAAETERVSGGWAAVAAALEARLAQSFDAAVAVELAELEANALGRADAAALRLERALEGETSGPAREDAFALLEELLERTRDAGRLEALWARERARESPAREYQIERLCDSAIRRGDLRRAAEALGRPTLPRRTVRLATLLQDAGDSGAAIEAFEAAQASGDQSGEDPLGMALRAGALALDRAQSPDLAAIWYGRAHAIAPASAEADLGLDTALAALDRRADRIRATLSTLEAAPRSESWTTRALERAWLLADESNRPEALAQLDAIEAVEPDRPDVAVLRFVLLFGSRSWDAVQVQLVRLAALEDGDLGPAFLLEAAETAELGSKDPARALDLYLQIAGRVAPPRSDSLRARAGVVRTAVRLATADAVGRAADLAQGAPEGFEAEDLAELAGLSSHVLADDARAQRLAQAAIAALPDAEPAFVQCTLLGALRSADRAADAAESARIALDLAARVDDVSVATALRMHGARSLEAAGMDPLEILQGALETSGGDPAVLHALARHSPRLDPALRARIAELRADEARDDPAERAVELGLRAEALAESGDLEGAWALLEEAHELQPLCLSCLLSAQDVAEQIGEPRRLVLATERLAAAFEDADLAADAWIEAGTLYSDAIRDPAAAIRCFLAADRSRPGDRSAFGALRALFVEGGRWNELARLLAHQLGLGQPVEATVELLWQRALVEGWTGNIDGARRDLDAVLAAQPDHLGALEWRAAIHALERQDDAALETYERLLRALERDGRPDGGGLDEQRFATTCIRIGEVGRRVGLDPTAILDVMGRALERRPSCPHALRHAADQAIRLGQWDDAAATLERLAPLCDDPQRRARTEMELCRIHSGERYDQDAAGLAVRRALAADPLSLDAVVALVELSAWVVTPVELAQRLDVAIAARRVALDSGREPRWALFLAELAVLQRLRGREEQAELVGGAARLAGEDPERVTRTAMPPSLERGRVKLEHIDVDLPEGAPRPMLPPEGELKDDLHALLQPDRTAAEHRVEALWQLLGPAVVRRLADERIGAAWQRAARQKARPDEPLMAFAAPIAGLLAAGRVEIIRSDEVPGIALGRRTVTVLGDSGVELAVDSRVEAPPPPAVAYRLARAVATAVLDVGTLELVRHDSLVAAFEAAKDAGSALVEKLGKKERTRARDLLCEVGPEDVESWYLSRRLGLAQLLMVLAPDVGSAAKELGADPRSLDRLCLFLASARFESLRNRVRHAH
ncbi:MAG: hypothetical protein HYY06_09205 [Deltaproteobacteria bacterium]|nr:hypothetical protein [Deltaproteobacteria bacterium]